MFKLLIDALEIAAASADAAARARVIYNTLMASAQQSKELTPEQSAQLNTRAHDIFASEASKPSGR